MRNDLQSDFYKFFSVVEVSFPLVYKESCLHVHDVCIK